MKKDWTFKWTIRLAICTPLLIILAMLFAGAGHGTILPMAIFFPYTTLLATHSEELGFVSILIAVFQFPLYGLLIDKLIRTKWRLLVTILVVHIIFIALNFR